MADNNDSELSPIEKLSQKISKRDGGPSLAELTEQNTEAIKDLAKAVDKSEKGLSSSLNPLKGLSQSFGKLKDSLLKPFKNFGTALARPFKKVGEMIRSPFKAVGEGVKKVKGVFEKGEEVKIKDLQLQELQGINEKMGELLGYFTDETREANMEENAREQIARNERRHDEVLDALKKGGRGGGGFLGMPGGKGGKGGLLGGMDDVLASIIIARFGLGPVGRLLGKIPGVRKLVPGFLKPKPKIGFPVPKQSIFGRTKNFLGNAGTKIAGGFQATKGFLGKAGAKALTFGTGALASGKALLDNVKANQAAKKATQEATEKAATKAAGKGLGKAALKKIPGIGLIAGGIFGLGRALQGDFAGAALEVASGASSLVPGAGTAGSVAIDAALIARDINKANEEGDAQAMEKVLPEAEAPKETDTPVKKKGFFARLFEKKEKEISARTEDFVPKGQKQSEFSEETYSDLYSYASDGKLFAPMNSKGKPRSGSISLQAGSNAFRSSLQDLEDAGPIPRAAYVMEVNKRLKSHGVIKKKEFITEAQMIDAGIMPPRKEELEVEKQQQEIPIPAESVTGEKASGMDLGQASQAQQQADQALSDFESSGKEYEEYYEDVDGPAMRRYTDPEDQKKYQELRMAKFDAADAVQAAREQITGKTDADKINFLKSKGIELEGFEYGDSVMGSDGKEIFNFKGTLRGGQLDDAMDQYFNAQALTPTKDNVGKQLLADGGKVERDTAVNKEAERLKEQQTAGNLVNAVSSNQTSMNNNTTNNTTINNSNHLDDEGKAKYVALVGA